MKRYIFFLAGFFSFAGYAQTSYIIKKDHTKIFVDDNQLSIIPVDKRVSYKLPGKEWEKYVKFSDLDRVVSGLSLFKSFKLDGKNRSSAYYVLGETSERSLLTIVIAVTSTAGKMSSTVDHYYWLIIDKDSNVLEEGHFTGSPKDRNTEEKTRAAGLIKKHFADCELLMARLDSLNKNDEDKMEFNEFFLNPIYIKCN